MIKPLSKVLAVLVFVALAVFGNIPAAFSLVAGQAQTGSSASVLPPGWKLKFSSDFSGTTVNSKVWGTCYPWSPKGCTNFANGNEKEWYQASQVKVSDGILHLVALRKPTKGRAANGSPKTYQCRSGMVTTFPGFRFKYGLVQVRARVPNGTGLWSAFWLAAANEKWPPEIDILEHWASAPTISKVYLHPTQGPRQGTAFNSPGISSGWHTFRLLWTKSSLTWYYDGQQVFTTTTGIPQQSMYLIANLADYSISSGACSGTLLVKSVKIWQP